MLSFEEWNNSSSGLTPLEFFTKRKEGAKKIATEAKAKGGPSMLTFWHFAAKDVPYQEVLQAIKSKQKETYFRSKWQSIMTELHNGKLPQEKFQKVIGKAEVWGETLAQLFN